MLRFFKKSPFSIHNFAQNSGVLLSSCVKLKNHIWHVFLKKNPRSLHIFCPTSSVFWLSKYVNLRSLFYRVFLGKNLRFLPVLLALSTGFAPKILDFKGVEKCKIENLILLGGVGNSPECRSRVTRVFSAHWVLYFTALGLAGEELKKDRGPCQTNKACRIRKTGVE